MNIQLELFYTPIYARWEQNCVPQPLYSLSLATDLSKAVILLGSGRETMNRSGIQSRRGHPVTILELVDRSATPRSSPVRKLSRFALEMWWSETHGVEVTRRSGWGRCPIAVRAFGAKEPRELEPDELYATRSSDVVVRIGETGFWLRTAARDPHDLPSPDPTVLTSDETEPMLDGARDAVVSRITCPRAREDALHLLDPTVECSEQHDRPRRLLLSLMTHCLPQLTWPPEGWYLPGEVTEHRKARMFTLLGTNSNPTNDTRELLKTMSEFSALRFSPDDTPMIVDMAVKHGWLPPHFWHDAAEFLTDRAAVDWSIPPKESVFGGDRLEFDGVVSAGPPAQRRPSGSAD